jgi:hypothetical protein
MCEVRSREKQPRTQKKKYNGPQQKEMDCHEPHPAPNEKMQGIQWTERPTGALVVAGSLWPLSRAFQQYEMHGRGLGDLNVRNKTNKQPSLRDRLVWPMLLAIIEFKI